MSEIAGLCIIGALLLFICWREWCNMKERRALTNTIVSRTAGESRMLNQDLDRSFRLPEPVKVGEHGFWGDETPDGFEGQVGL